MPHWRLTPPASIEADVSVITILFQTQHAEGKWPHQASEAQHGAGLSDRSQEGREVVQAGGGQAAVGLHQGEEAAGPNKQTVLRARQGDGAHLWKGKDSGIRHGEIPQKPPHLIGTLKVGPTYRPSMCKILLPRLFKQMSRRKAADINIGKIVSNILSTASNLNYYSERLINCDSTNQYWIFI